VAPDALVGGAQKPLGSALHLASELGAPGQWLAAVARHVFMSGATDAFYVSGGLLVLAALLLGVLIPRESRPELGPDVTDVRPDDARVL
jgi:hypothetical protein